MRSTVIFVPRFIATLSTDFLFPNSYSTFVFSSPSLVSSVKTLIEAIEGIASPLKPNVVILNKSFSSTILLVA